MNSYKDFLKKLDNKLKQYAELHKQHINCKAGCSYCCEKGDYPLSEFELEYMMQGFISLDDKLKIQVQTNINNMKRGEECPFLIEKQCVIYPYRPIICRVHGLAYLCKNNTVKVPYCANEGKNYSTVYNNGEININPILENLDTQSLLKDFNCGEIHNLYDFIGIKNQNFTKP